MDKHKYDVIMDICASENITNNDDILNVMQAFDDLLERGFIEKFTNAWGEIDYRVTGRIGTLDILQNKQKPVDLEAFKVSDD